MVMLLMMILIIMIMRVCRCMYFDACIFMLYANWISSMKCDLKKCCKMMMMDYANHMDHKLTKIQ